MSAAGWVQSRDLASSVHDAFASRFGGAPDGVWAAPGRVNVMGEHVDYNAGLCLPIALPHRTFAAVRRRDDGRVALASAQRPDEEWTGALDDIGPGLEPGWAAYLAGVLWALRQGDDGSAAGALDVPGVDVLVDSAVPVGAGLSSSAALECSLAVAVAELLGLGQDEDVRIRLAAACVRAENEIAGASTGGMDQAIALRATEGHALLLDTRDHSAVQVPLDLDAAGLALLVVDTRAAHELNDGQYAERRADCDEAVRRLGVSSLREVTDLDDALRRLDDEPRLARRTRHVVTEIARVHEVVDLLRSGHADRTGPALDASHRSLREDYEVSSVELDTAVEAARAAGALGARMTGGGFGGSAIALVPSDATDEVAGAVRDAFAAAGLDEPGFLRSVPSGPAGRVL
jgi:galactokinase